MVWETGSEIRFMRKIIVSKFREAMVSQASGEVPDREGWRRLQGQRPTIRGVKTG